MGTRGGERYMRHALPSYLGLNDLYATFFADDPSVFHALVFAAVAFIVFGRTENLGAEQTVTFRLKGSIIDCLRLFNLSMRPFQDLLR